MSGERRTGCVHIVGAGLAGLAAAVRLIDEGRFVQLYEATRYAGGRCRSYFDEDLRCRIDNGNHLLLAGNHTALDYLQRIGACDTLIGPRDPAFPFVDAVTGQRWTVRPTRGALPWWILSSKRRVPETRVIDYLGVLGLRRAGRSATVAEVLGRDRSVFRRFWEPLTIAALNTSAEQASAALFGRVLAETFGRGGAACRPLVPRDGLSETFVERALDCLRIRGAEIRFGSRLRELIFGEDSVSALGFDTGPIELGGDDAIILAVTAPVAARLVPTLTVPDVHSPIVNAHFLCDSSAAAPLFVGVLGGTAEWIFRKNGVLSVTVSAADRIVDRTAHELRDLFWHDVSLAYQLPMRPIPRARIVKERRATFLASPEQLGFRPGQITAWKNLLLAGDYVNTGLPGTIEGAIRSGFTAARLALDRLPDRLPGPMRGSTASPPR